LSAGLLPLVVSGRQEPEDAFQSEANKPIIRNRSKAVVPVDRGDTAATAEKSDLLIEPVELADNVKSRM